MQISTEKISYVDGVNHEAKENGPISVFVGAVVTDAPRRRGRAHSVEKGSSSSDASRFPLRTQES